MANHFIIRRILAGLLLLLFVFSITPKKYWHDLVANHTDYYGFYQGSELAVQKAGINCGCEDLVVTTPFLEPGVAEWRALPASVKPELTSPPLFYLPATTATKDSRGPPAQA